VLDLLPESSLHRSRHVFDWHVRSTTVLIEKVDGMTLTRNEPSDLLECASGRLTNPTCCLYSDQMFHPNLVAITTCHGRERGFATSSSLMKGPYTSAVSKNVTPSSTAARITGIISCLSFGRTVAEAHSHAAGPIAENFQVAVPKFALSAYFSFGHRLLSCVLEYRSSGIRAPLLSARPSLKLLTALFVVGDEELLELLEESLAHIVDGVQSS